MTAERVFRILWGPALENALDFAWPTVGSSPLHWRAPRAQSQLVTSGASSVAWITGRYYRLKVTAQYFGATQNFGGTGLQAFLDWAMDSNAFTLVPNIAVPALTVTGCYLEGPFDALSPSLDQDATQTLDMTMLHPTQDLGLAWRGLWFEYVAGGSLTDPVAYTFSRASVGYEVTPAGYIFSHPTDSICDGHYTDPLTDGLQTTLLEDAVTNDITNPEDLSNGSWTKTNATITANNAKAPDKNVTADLLKENTDVNLQHETHSTAYAIASADPVTALVFLRDAGRHRGLFRITDGPGTNFVGVNYDLHAGTIATNKSSSATLTGSRIVPLAGGWFMIWLRGAVNGGITSVIGQVSMYDGSGNFLYNGDGASGVYVWGMTAVHGTVRKQVASYTPTTSVADTLTAPWMPAPQAQWDYVKLVDWCPDTDGAQTYAILQTGDTASVNPRAYIVKSALTFTAFHANSSTSGTSSVAAGLSAGDTIEVLRIIDNTGAVTIRVSVNGGAEAVGPTSGGLAFAPAWNAQVLSLFNIGGLRYYGGLARVKSGPYVATGPTAVTTIAIARAV